MTSTLPIPDGPATPRSAATPHAHSHDAKCEHCIVSAPSNRSATTAWIIAGIAVSLLLAVFFLGAGSAGGTLLAGAGGFTLLALLACPLMMGGMMWFMMRKQH